MQEYIASIDAPVYVLDYDYNATSVEHLQNTHYPFYEKIRKAHKDAPIIFISLPNSEQPLLEKRRAVIYDTYCKAKVNGDNLVWFIDGETMFGTHGRSDCTVDTCHPNDLGFYRMASAIYPVLKEALQKVK